MKRRIFNCAAALSLMLCVAVCVLWVRSYWVADWWYRGRTSFTSVPGNPNCVHMRETAIWLEVGRGGAAVAMRRQDADWSMHPAPDNIVVKSEHRVEKLEYPAPISRRWLGFAYWWVNYAPRYAGWSRWLCIPFWFLTTLFAVPSVLWIRRRRSARRLARENRCLTCGYDLRATPDRCPECGNVVKA